MKCKILIAAQSLEIGGAERSLVSLLNSFDYSKVEVHLFLCRQMGEFMQYIPPEVKLLPEDPNAAMLAKPFGLLLKKHRYQMMIGRTYSKVRSYCYNRRNHLHNSSVELEYSHKYTYKFVKSIMQDIEYDYAISFLTPHYIVAHKVRAKRKGAWIHTDYSSIKIDVESEKRMWSQYDDIISISESCTEGFVKVFPDLKSKIILIENVLDSSFIHEEATKRNIREELSTPKSQICLCTVGRFAEPKNMELIPEMCREILNRGIDIGWILVGYGPKEQLIRENIVRYKVEDRVFIMGKQDNPYPYIDACDVYVQPSSYEGKSVTVREAQILGKAVVISNYPTASQQLENQVDGVILPLEKKEFVDGLYAFIQNTEMRMKIQENCRMRDYSNREGVEKLYDLFG